MNKEFFGALKFENRSKLSEGEWLDIRRKGLGGSDIGVMFGENKYKSEISLWLEKTTGYNPGVEENEAMRQGKDLEQYVVDRFCEKTGKKVIKQDHILQSKNHYFMLANIDGYIDGEDSILECKTANSLKYSDYLNDKIPTSYVLQCFHYMLVCPKVKKVYLAVLVFGRLFKIYEFERNDEVLDALKNKEISWWKEHVQDNIIPDVDGSRSTDQALRHLYKENVEEEIHLDESFDILCDEINLIKEKLKALEKVKSISEQKLKVAIKENTKGVTDNYCITNNPNKNNVKMLKIKKVRENTNE